MPTNDPPPAGIRLRVRPRHLRRSAAGLLLVVCAANQAAARDGPLSLPYLAQAPAKALRIAPPVIRSVAPPRPGAATAAIAVVDDATVPGAEAPASETAAANRAAPTGGQSDSPTAKTIPQPDPGSAVRTLPDTYSPVQPTRIEDILPYLYSEGTETRAVSRATYELK